MENLVDKLFNVLGVKTKDEAKQKFSEMLGDPKPVEYKDLTTQDGSVLMLDGELVVGSSVMVQTESGPAPAPDGEYVLQDGTQISIMGGKIAEVSAPEAPQPEGMSADLTAILEKYESRIKALEDALLTATQNQAEAQTAMKAQTDKFSKAVELIEKVLEMPAHEPVKQEEFKSEKVDKYADLARTLAALKKEK